MDGKTKVCMGVRCFNQTSCSTVPATKGEEDLQIAHLTDRSLAKNVTIGENLNIIIIIFCAICIEKLGLS